MHELSRMEGGAFLSLLSSQAVYQKATRSVAEGDGSVAGWSCRLLLPSVRRV